MATQAAGLGCLGELQTGDLVLFAGPRPLLRLFGRVVGSAWAHVGIVVREADDVPPLLLESDPHRAAVREIPLEERVAHFRGRVSARRLSHELKPLQRARLDPVRRELAPRQRPRGLLDLIAAGDDGWIGASTKILGVLAAGELVAEAYVRLGLLEGEARGGLPASRYRPRHFGENARLQLKGGYALGPELPLRTPEEAAAPVPFSPQPA